MNLFISWIVANLALIVANPASITYLALTVVHLVILRRYLDQGEHRHALCAGLAAVLYVVLACIDTAA